MNEHILNIITQLLCYSDPNVTDNPHQRAFDHTRRIQNITLENPRGDSLRLAPGASFSIFDGTIANALSGASVLDMELLSAVDSIYRINVTAGPSAFKTARSPSGLAACAVTINNNAMAEFDFTGATLTGVQVGDIMRVAGDSLHDTGPFAFNSLNAGIWKVIGVAGTKISAVRMVGESFSGATESVAAVGGDVEFYADDGVQAGDKFEITGTFSQVSRRVYEVKDVTPSAIQFVSATPIPVEIGPTFVPGSLIVYRSYKKLVYIECDQDAVVRFNADTSDNNKLTPIEAGNRDLPAFMHKWGAAYNCTIVNKSVNPMNVRFFTGE